MSIPQPKILTALTVPSGGWGLRVKITDSVAFDTTVNVSLDAGDYFMAWDGQSDCFLQHLHDKLYAGLVASGISGYSGTDDGGKPVFWIDSNHKVNVVVYNKAFQIDWTALNGSSIAAVLGFTSAAALSLSSNTLSTASYHHAYGWYADSEALMERMREDIPIVQAVQSAVPGGQISTQYHATRYRNQVRYQRLDAEKIWSNGVGYAAASTDPWARNEALECWWHSACQGVRFRVYDDAVIDATKAEVRGVGTGSTSTTLTDTARAFVTEPQEHAGKLLYMPEFGQLNTYPQRARISSHNTQTLTIANDLHNTAIDTTAYRIFDQRYGTYVLDIKTMGEFAPRELPQIDKYDIEIPLWRYVA